MMDAASHKQQAVFLLGGNSLPDSLCGWVTGSLVAVGRQNNLIRLPFQYLPLCVEQVELQEAMFINNSNHAG
jgi:hypothetical protein